VNVVSLSLKMSPHLLSLLYALVKAPPGAELGNRE
jgi:hypothetical protein